MNKSLLFFLLAAIALAFVGCATSGPISTDVEWTPSPAAGEAAFRYASEKDILYSHIETDPATGIVTATTIEVLASAPALALAKVKAVEAETSRANAQMGLAALQAIIPLVSPLPPAPQSPPAPAAL